jgi:hypothetical protein
VQPRRLDQIASLIVQGRPGKSLASAEPGDAAVGSFGEPPVGEPGRSLTGARGLIIADGVDDAPGFTFAPARQPDGLSGH